MLNIYTIGKRLLIISFMFGTMALLIVTIIPDAMIMTKTQQSSMLVVQKANASEIYPEFVCGCYSKALDPKNICCGSAQGMIDYIDFQVASDLSKDQIMMKTMKEFGFNSLAKEETKRGLKLKLAANAPKIVLEEKLYDFGDVSQSDGIISTEFSFKNDGKSDLIIEKISTSCGCTEASIVYQGVEGPTFTMPGHGKENPTGWSISIAPGDSAQIKVYYDPNAYGKQKEKELLITRTIDIFSNDPIEFEKQVRIELNQLL